MKEGGCVLNISNAAAIVVCKLVTGQNEFDLTRCPAICLNLPYTEIYVTVPIEDGKDPVIMQMQAGPEMGLWIRDAPCEELSTYSRQRKELSAP